jgi:hypothetical protein
VGKFSQGIRDCTKGRFCKVAYINAKVKVNFIFNIMYNKLIIRVIDAYFSFFIIINQDALSHNFLKRFPRYNGLKLDAIQARKSSFIFLNKLIIFPSLRPV